MRKKRRERAIGQQVSAAHGQIVSVLDDQGTIQIDSGALPVPSNSYDADYVWVANRYGAISLFFAKGTPGRQEIVSRVEVRYPYEAFIGHFWASSRAFHGQLREQTARFAGRFEREDPKPETRPPIKQHSVWANLDFMARHGSVVSLDFYYLAPSAVFQFGRTRDVSKLVVDPVLRVVTTAIEILGLLDSSEALVREVAAFVQPVEAGS